MRSTRELESEGRLRRTDGEGVETLERLVLFVLVLLIVGGRGGRGGVRVGGVGVRERGVGLRSLEGKNDVVEDVGSRRLTHEVDGREEEGWERGGEDDGPGGGRGGGGGRHRDQGELRKERREQCLVDELGLS